MRATLFLSTLFAVSLLGGAALADKAHVVNRLRSRGDIVDKNYQAARKVSRAASQQQATHAQRPGQHAGLTKVDRGASRINCSADGGDCSRARPSPSSHASGLQASAEQTNRSARWPAFLDRYLGSDRMACNEADECSMSNRAVKRAWQRAAARNAGAASHAGTGGKVSNVFSRQEQVARSLQQASKDRMACNEAGECSMSNKGVRRAWARASIKAGTFNGPVSSQPNPAAVAVLKRGAAVVKAPESKAKLDRPTFEREHTR